MPENDPNWRPGGNAPAHPRESSLIPAGCNETPGPTVAICAVVRDEASYIEEWVAFHRRQGVTVWRVYDNGSVDGTPAILRRLGIEPIVWAERPHDFAGQQCKAYLEGGQALGPFADWVAYIDVDEFLFGRDGKTLREVLASFPAETGAIAVQQVIFGSSGHVKRTEGPVTARFTRSAPREHPECRWFKTIARPRWVGLHDSAHSVALRGGQYVMVDGSPLTRAGSHPGVATRRVEGLIGLHHYIIKSREEFEIKSAKWSDRLSGKNKRSDYFTNREVYANLVECTEIAPPGMAPMSVPAATPMSPTAEYWEKRYRDGGNSGAGSSGRLADFKAGIINCFVDENKIATVIEFGCGDGNMLSMLSLPNYVGLDVSPTALAKCRARFARKPEFRFMSYDQLADVSEADLVLSVDVIFHLLEDGLFESYMRNLFMFSKRFVIIYSSNHDSPTTLHIRHHNVTSHVARRFPEWRLVAHIPNLYPVSHKNQPDTTFCDFFIFQISAEPCLIAVPPPLA